MKTRLSKTKCFKLMFIPVTRSIIHIPLPKRKKEFFCDAKVTEGPEAPEGPLRVLFRFLSDRVLFRFLSDRVLFESPVIGSSSWSSVIDSSLGSSVLFFCHAAIYQNVLLHFFLKADVLFYIIFSKRFSHPIISREKNEEILAGYKDEILYWKYMSSIP